MKLPKALGEGSRARLKNERGLDLVNVVVSNSIDGVPTWARTDNVFVYLHAAPGGNNDLWVSFPHQI